MFKFFRKIRQNLLMENNTGKYIKYAFGEIILVVIGILIALQINNWNQQRLQDNEEQAALINLKQDFEYNYKTLDSVLSETKNNITAQFILLNHTGNKPKNITRETFNKALNKLADINEFYPRNGYLNDLISSGNLGIIKNKVLRNKLSSWNPAFDYIRSREIELEKGRDRVTQMIIQKGSWLNADAVSTDQVVKNNIFPKSGFEIDNRNLLNELEFENNTENTIYQNDKLTQSHKKGLLLISQILELLEQEINASN